MLIEQLNNSDSLKVTVHCDNISARDALSLSRAFKEKARDMGLSIPTPNKFDHLQYTDLFFRVPEQPEGWQDVFMEALQGAVDEKGWSLSDEDGQVTQISELNV